MLEISIIRKVNKKNDIRKILYSTKYTFFKLDVDISYFEVKDSFYTYFPIIIINI